MAGVDQAVEQRFGHDGIREERIPVLRRPFAGQDQWLGGDGAVGDQVVEVIALGRGVLTHREVIRDRRVPQSPSRRPEILTDDPCIRISLDFQRTQMKLNSRGMPQAHSLIASAARARAGRDPRGFKPGYQAKFPNSGGRCRATRKGALLQRAQTRQRL